MELLTESMAATVRISSEQPYLCQEGKGRTLQSKTGADTVKRIVAVYEGLLTGRPAGMTAVDDTADGFEQQQLQHGGKEVGTFSGGIPTGDF